MKKALKALVVAIAVVFSFAAWADDVNKTVDGVTYTYEIVAVFGNPSAPPEARIKGVNLNGKSQIAVPEALDGKPVTSIASSAFENKTGLRVVELPASLTTIWDSAFKGCTSLESVIGGGLTDIHNYAFHGCSSLIDTPDDFSGLKTVGRQAFYGCSSLEEICLPDSLNALGDGAFENCSSLQNAYLPAFFAYSDLRDRYFKGCPAGLNVFSRASVDGTAWNFKFVDGGVELCFDVFLWGPTIDYDTAGHVEIPGELCNRSVVSIGKNAFEFCADITSMTIPASVTKIEKWALEDTSLETVYVDKGDADRVRGLLEASGYDVGEVAFLDGSEDEVVPVEATWYTTRAEAFAAARKTGKKVFMICGHDGCLNTMYTKNYSCEQPKVKSELVAKCVLWYSNCNTQFDENYYYWPNGTFTLPLVCVIDPDNDKGFIVRRTGPLDPEDIIAMLVGIPYPAMDDYANLDPFYPGEMPGYKVVNPADIWDPIQAPKAVVLHGALYYGNGVEGVIELKVGKLKNYQAKVSGTATLLDGKKYTVKSKKCDFGDKLASVLTSTSRAGEA